MIFTIFITTYETPEDFGGPEPSFLQWLGFVRLSSVRSAVQTLGLRSGENHRSGALLPDLVRAYLEHLNKLCCLVDLLIVARSQR